MCNPVAFSVASSVQGYLQGSANAKAVNRAQDAAFRRTQELVGAQRDLRDNAIRTQQIQRARQAVDQIRKTREQAERALGLVRLSGAESGVAGGALESVLADFQRQEAEEALTIITNKEFADAAAEQELKANKLTAQAQIEAAVPVPVAGPSLLGTILQIGGSIALGDAGLMQDKLAVGNTTATPFGSSLSLSPINPATHGLSALPPIPFKIP